MKVESERTEIVRGDEQVRDAVLDLFARAKTRLDISAATLGYVMPEGMDDFVKSLVGLRERGLRPRLVTEISKKEIETGRLAVQLLEVRHLAGLKATFAVTDREYLSLPVAGGGPSPPLVYSNAEKLVEQQQSIFDRLWASGEPAGKRIRALESGSELPEIEVIRDSNRIRELYLSAVKGAKRTVLLLLPSAGAYSRDERIGVVDALLDAVSRGANVRLLAPIGQTEVANLASRARSRHRGSLTFRSIPSAETQETVTVLVVDDSVSMTIDDDNPLTPEFDLGLGVATLVTQKSRMRANIRFFERSWTESELREAEQAARQREEVNRRRAELMQDILTHDIRNFNQVTRLNAELLDDQVEDRDSKKRISAILKAVDGSSRLIERTKKLGNILSAASVDLRPTGVRPSIERSISLVRKANPERALRVKSKLKGTVLADALLDEVFTNILSNSVRYTEGDPVNVVIEQEEVTAEAGTGEGTPGYWKITFVDFGRGIPDEMKPVVFRRYLESAKGSGLGMSIVHALVTERYGGKVDVRDRVEGDHTKGTKVEVWLRRASH